MTKRGPYIKHGTVISIDCLTPFPVPIDPMAAYLKEALLEKSVGNYRSAGQLAYYIASRYTENTNRIRCYLRRELIMYF